MTPGSYLLNTLKWNVTIYKLVNKLYFTNNSILFQNQWTLHHHLSKHVKINCLHICKFTSRYKTYRWSCGHCVVAYWGRKWLAREIQFVKKTFCENVQCKSIYKQSQEYAVPGIFSPSPGLQFYSRFSTNLWGNTTVEFSAVNEQHECLCALLRLIRSYLTLEDPRLIFSHGIIRYKLQLNLRLWQN